MTNSNKTKRKEAKSKKVVDQYKTDRLIARIILGFGLSLTVASAVACGITHPKISDVKDEYWDAKDSKNAYLDTFEQSDEFKTTYNADIETLNDRLIAHEIDGNTYDKELEKLKDNKYTEKVLFENGSEQTKAEFNEINQKYIDAENNFNKNAMPFYLTSMGPLVLPISTAFSYHLWKPSKKEEETQENQNTL